MSRPLIAGNWKMNGSGKNIAELMKKLLELQCKSDIVIFPPYVYIPQVVTALSDKAIAVGAQDVCEYNFGAYTGEVSSEMLKDIGCTYCLVGHSERRGIYGEDNSKVASKFYQASLAGLKPILCLGETLEQKKKGETLGLICEQIDAILDRAGKNSLSNAVIAYEPIWAIGTGETASADQAQEVHAALRARLQQLDADLAETTPILYGGSVKANNASELFAQPDIDGGLVGGASLKADEFNTICASV